MEYFHPALVPVFLPLFAQYQTVLQRNASFSLSSTLAESASASPLLQNFLNSPFILPSFLDPTPSSASSLYPSASSLSWSIPPPYILAEPAKPSQNLQWMNVIIGLSFILFDICVSLFFKLGLASSLLVASLRCIGQLTLVAGLLKSVFETENPWLVVLIAFLLNLLGTIEVVINKSPRRFKHMFPAVFTGMLCSIIPISILGTRFAMSVQPFWKPVQYIPIVGMLCGSTISGIVVSTSYILKELIENRDKVEIYLAFGASRAEACRPIVVEALRLALTHPINNMSVLGIISIPGMMTGAILGGADVAQAARLQMIIMFMITASTSLASILTSFAAVTITVDNHHRIRGDRVTERAKELRRIKSLIVNKVTGSQPSSPNPSRIVSRTSSLDSTTDTENNSKAKGVVKSAGDGIQHAGSRTKRAFVGVWIWLDACVRSVFGRLGYEGNEGETRGLLD